MKVNVIVKPKEAVLDPQGHTVRDAMRHLGMPEVRSVRIGKYMEIEIEGNGGDVEKRLHGLCRDLLSNPVIEDYEMHKPEVTGQKSQATRTKTSNGQQQLRNTDRGLRKANGAKSKIKRKKKSSR